MAPPTDHDASSSSIEILDYEPEDGVFHQDVPPRVAAHPEDTFVVVEDYEDVSTEEEVTPPQSPSAPRSGVCEADYDPVNEDELLADTDSEPLEDQAAGRIRRDSDTDSALSADSVLEKLHELRDAQESFEIDEDPLWDPIRSHTREFAALFALKPSIAPDLAKQVILCSHRSCGYCPLMSRLGPWTRAATNVEEYPEEDPSTDPVAKPYPDPQPRQDPAHRALSTPPSVAFTLPGPSTVQPGSTAARPVPETVAIPVPEVPERRDVGVQTDPPVPPPGSSDHAASEPGPSTPSPMVTEDTSGPRYGRCFNCGSPSHTKPSCRKPKTRHCNRCGHPGVSVRECPLHGQEWRARGPWVPQLGRNVSREEILERPKPDSASDHLPHQGSPPRHSGPRRNYQHTPPYEDSEWHRGEEHPPQRRQRRDER